MEKTLIDAGLNKLQAQAYIYLLDNGYTAPGELINKLDISRTNTYKVLDSLENLGLIKKEKRDKRIVYRPENPIALVSLVAEKRNSLIELEHNVNKALQHLNRQYQKTVGSISVETYTGHQLMMEAYLEQAEQKLPIYFFKSRADIPFFGFDLIHRIRKKQGELSPHRFAIATDSPEAPKNPNIDKRTHLKRFYIDESDYTAPVEWSMSGNSLLIQIFDGKGRSIVIKDRLVAESFKEIWQLTKKSVNMIHDQHPIKAKRKI